MVRMWEGLVNLLLGETTIVVAQRARHIIIYPLMVYRLGLEIRKRVFFVSRFVYVLCVVLVVVRKSVALKCVFVSGQKRSRMCARTNVCMYVCGARNYVVLVNRREGLMVRRPPMRGPNCICICSTATGGQKIRRKHTHTLIGDREIHLTHTHTHA